MGEELQAALSIEASGLTKSYGQLTAVDGIALQVRQGEFFGFLGPNGAGKSTTIRMLCGLLRPSAGTIRIAGFDPIGQPLEVKQRIGILLEESALYERLSSAEFLRFAGRMHGLSVAEADSRAAELLDIMELTEAQDKLIVDYSMGMRKKTALAAALIHSPAVIFLDEPFNGIDPVSVRAIRNVLKRLTDRGATVFFTSHVMEVVERLCSRVAVINRGRIVGEGTLAELRDRSATAGDSSLEEVFLKLVDARVDEGSLSWT